MTPSRDVHRFLPLRPVEFDILLGLGPEARHGYAILQATEARTDGRVRPELGTLYRALRRMEEEGLIAEAEAPDDEPADDDRRRYYRITPLGREVAAAEIERMESLVAEGRRRNLAGEAGGA